MKYWSTKQRIQSYFFSRSLCWRKFLFKHQFQVCQQTVTGIPVYTHSYKPAL